MRLNHNLGTYDRPYILLGAIGLAAILAGTAFTNQFSASTSALAGGELTVGDQSKEMVQFFKAKECLFKQDWAGAKAGLEQYQKDYPSGR